MQTANLYRVLMWIAAGLTAIAGIIETTEGDYLKAATSYCMALVFLLLPVASMSAKSQRQKTAWILMILLMLLWVGLFAYRLMGRKGL